MPEFSLRVTPNDLPIVALLKELLPLTISAHHINTESEHCHMDSCWHLIDCRQVCVENLVLIFPGKTVIQGGDLFDGFEDDSYSALVKEIEVVDDWGAFLDGFFEMGGLIGLEEELAHFLDVESGFTSFLGQNLLDGGHMT